MDLTTAIKALRSIGLNKALQSVWYSLQRDLLKGPRRLTGLPKPPGALQEINPAPSGARLRFENATLEVRFLTPDFLVYTWQPGTLPIPYAIAQDRWPPVEVSMRRQGRGWTLAGPALSLTISDDGSLRFQDAAGHTLRHETPPLRRGEEWHTSAHLRKGERIYGLGEHAGGPNLRGHACLLWNTDPGGSYTPDTEPLYLGVPTYLALHPAGSYLVFYENSFQASFTFNTTAEARFAGGALRCYFSSGTPPQLLQRYSDLTGRPALPPRWALGHHQSRWGYMSAADVRAVVEGFRVHDLPLSAIHLDIDYMDGFRVFTAHPERFPDLAALAGELESQGVRLVAIVDCGVKRDRRYAVFREGLEQGAFCTRPDGRPVYGPVWPGWSAFPDFTDPQARAWWGRHYRFLTTAGIAGFWHDMNEPAVLSAWGDPTLPLATRHSLEGRGGDHREAHNLYGLLMARAGFEALRELRPERRPWILSRSGWAGLQRYAWTWTGDTASTWPALRATVATVLGLGLSGLPFTGPDIGGFSGAPSDELYLRWFQMAALLPFFRTHSALGTPRREPWVWGEPTLSILRDWLRLRVRLLPYLYTLAWETSQTGWPMVRPLFWPNCPEESLWDVADAFLLGDALLVAPVVEEGAAERSVPLPPGGWYDFWSDRPLVGPASVRLAAPRERLPLLVRAGSVLPLEEDGRLVLHLYAPAAGTEGGGSLYCDAGDGYGLSRVDRFSLVPREDGLELRWEAQGEYPWPYAQVTARVHGMAARHAWVDGREVAVQEGCFPIEPLRPVRIS